MNSFTTGSKSPLASRLLVTFSMVCAVHLCFAIPPSITGFSPAAGPVGTIVTITGTNFSTTPSNNSVYFGTTLAEVVSGSTTQLIVKVPAGATFQPISVTLSRSTAFSSYPFLVTFPDGGALTACAFSAKTDHATGAGPYSVAVGDLTSDGRPEVVTANHSDNTITVHLNTGTSFTSGAVTTNFDRVLDLAAGTNPLAVAIGDVNSDNQMDIVVANTSSNTVSIFKNVTEPDLDFGPAINLTAGTSPHKIAVTDIDGDGKVDIVVLNKSGTGVSVFRHSGTTSVNSSTYPTRFDFAVGSNPADLAIGDIDGDGKPDILTANEGSDNFSVLRNTSTSGTITFDAHVVFSTGSGSSAPQGIAIGDLDLDGKPDVAVTNHAEDRVSVFSNTSPAGGVSFAAHMDFITPAGYDPNDIEMSDISGDGKVDIVITTQGTSGIYITKNNSSPGSLAFADFQYFPTDAAAWQLAIGDVDLDGRPDVTTAIYNDNEFSVFRNQVNSLPGFISSGYSPDNGDVGSTVTFTGTNFSTTLTNNEVFFNGVQALITSATSTEITAYVPFGATTGPIAIKVGCQTAITVLPFTVNSGPCVPTVERDALIDFYNSTGGDSWTNNTNWLNADVSTWFGVSLVGCEVFKLNLPNNNLVGVIPDNISDLAALNEIDLSNNQLYGDLTTGFGNLDGVEMLNLSNNLFSGLIPPELGDMAALIKLDLSTNQFSDIIPPELGNLTNLRELKLGTNELTGDIPPDLENLLNLKILSAPNNFLVVVASELGALPELVTVDVSNNLLGYIPSFTGPSITQLKMEKNYLDYGDLEPNIGVTGFSYDPQYDLPPGGVISFVPGSTLTIPFSTPGTGNIYKWYRNGVFISGATSSTLVKPGMAASDAGFYVIKITSSIVPGITLKSIPYTVITDPCGSVTRSSGGLDTSFNIDLDDVESNPALGLQSSGKVIASFNSNTIGAYFIMDGIVRLKTNGNPDNTFATNTYHPHANTMAVQSDDKIVTEYSDGTYAGVARLNDGGTDDVAFNAATPQYYSGNVSALALQPDQKIIVAFSDFSGDNFVERINTDGTSDASFTAPINLGPFVIRVKSTGKILVGSPEDIVQLTSSGSLDGSFNVSFNGFLTDIAVQSDGKIIMTGSFDNVNGNSALGIARLNADGSFDTSFGVIGVTDDPELGHAPYKITFQPDGKILIAGWFDNINGTDRKNLIRLNTDGSVDCPFDPLLSTEGGLSPYIYNMILQSDGKIIIGGDFDSYDGTPKKSFARVNTTGSTLTIDVQPEDETACLGATGAFQAHASGSTNLIYQWQFSPNGVIPFVDIADNAKYSGTSTNVMSVSTTGSFGAGRYHCRINGDLATEVITTDQLLTIVPVPTAPTAAAVSTCLPASITIKASGAPPGQEYQWYTVATGGSPISGEVSDTYVTPVLATTTTYYVSVTNGDVTTGSCESPRTAVVAAVSGTLAKPVITVSNCTTKSAVLSGPVGFNAYAWSNGATAQQITAGVAGSYTLIVTNSAGCTSVASDPTTLSADFCNKPPVITSASATGVVEGTVMVNLSALITDPDNNIDLATLKITKQPSSGAKANIDASFRLVLDYAGKSFSGKDELTVEVCDLSGKCAQQVITIEISGDIIIYTGISPNNDNLNDFWTIRYIEVIPDTKSNKVSVFNRWGDKVFETENYDNDTRVFKGLNTSGSELPNGVYFYKIEFTSGREMKTGYLSLRR